MSQAIKIYLQGDAIGAIRCCPVVPQLGIAKLVSPNTIGFVWLYGRYIELVNGDVP